MKAALGTPGTITLRGRDFAVPQPTAGDAGRVHDRMRELAARDCVSPLAFVNANAPQLSPAVLAESVRAAVAMGSGGGSEPTQAAVQRAYNSLDGVRFQVWYYARKGSPGLTQAEVDSLVAEEDRYDAADALAAALFPEAGGGGPKPPTGGAN